VEGVELLRARARAVWDYTLSACKSRFATRSTRQPYASHHDIIATALPFLIEHKLSGELLGLSGLLGVDCYDYLHGIVFDLKTVSSLSKLDAWHKLYPTGYAIVLESVYEVPIDIGCIVFVSFKDEKLILKPELFLISDDLRSWWLEERDTKLELVAQRKDPGTPNNCYENCIYWDECHG
jgi:CRISPR-associated protein Csa1